MLDDRKTAILRAIVQEYIATGQPVGSTHVAHAAEVQVSSATVRNEMAVLEQEGYLVQRHTSGGRIPTDKGYRFFVDHIATPGRLNPLASQRVGDFFGSAHGQIEQLLHQTTDLLAQLTHHAAVVVGPSQERTTVRSIQLVGLSDQLATVVTVMSNGAVEHQQIETAPGTSEARLNAAAVHLQASLVGQALDTPVPATGDEALDALCTTATAAIREAAAGEPVFVGGTASMAHAFDAVEVVRSVLRTLEQQYVIVSLVRDILDRGLTVAIGEEHGVQPLVACSVVVAPVIVEGSQIGTVGVLGPTRMDYPNALATVDAVSDRLAQRLSEGGISG